MIVNIKEFNARVRLCVCVCVCQGQVLYVNIYIYIHIKNLTFYKGDTEFKNVCIFYKALNFYTTVTHLQCIVNNYRVLTLGK